LPPASSYDGELVNGAFRGPHLSRLTGASLPWLDQRQWVEPAIAEDRSHLISWARNKPTSRVEHHKTGEIVDLEEELPDGTIVKFYEDAEELLSHLKRRDVPMILREAENGVCKPFAYRSWRSRAAERLANSRAA
jgi:hypothetical protein